MMSSSIISLEQQFEIQAVKNCLKSLSHQEIKKLLLIAVRQSIATHNLAEKIKLQNLENYIHSLNREKAQDIIFRVLLHQVRNEG